jgi:predicted HicB family RNase H-like nuclease
VVRKDPQFKLRIPAETLRALQVIADIRERSVTAIVNEAVTKFAEAAAADEQRKKMQIRLPLDLYADLKNATRVSGRSLNAEMIHRLKHFKE